jgi:hypothetical protein
MGIGGMSLDTLIRDYTIGCDGECSFRIQVALRTVVMDLDVQEDVLKRYMEGTDHGGEQQGDVDRILKGILVGIAEVCEKALEGALEKDITRRLWEEDLEVARTALHLLQRK